MPYLPFLRFQNSNSRVGSVFGGQVNFEDALTFCRDNGIKKEQAWACSDYTEALVDRDEDSDRVTRLQDEAIALATELGMQPLLERMLAKREFLKA